MNREELNNSLSFLNAEAENIQIIVYASFDGHVVRKMDIKNDDLPSIKKLFIDSIKNTIINKDNHSVIPLSSADERGNCFYQYDLDLPEELKLLKTIIGNDSIDTFNLRDDTFENIDALIIVLADEKNVISLYKKIFPIEILGIAGYLLWKSNNRLERFEEKLLRISSSFHVLQVGNEVIITKLEIIEKSFGFSEIIIREAKKGLKIIENMNIVSNIDALEELIDDVSFARKLTKITKDSQVLKRRIPNENIISFSKKHPAVKNKIKYTHDSTQFILDTKVSKDSFVKLLNDDFLTSELTKAYYDSMAKNGVDVEEKEINKKVTHDR